MGRNPHAAGGLHLGETRGGAGRHCLVQRAHSDDRAGSHAGRGGHDRGLAGPPHHETAGRRTGPCHPDRVYHFWRRFLLTVARQIQGVRRAIPLSSPLPSWPLVIGSTLSALVSGTAVPCRAEEMAATPYRPSVSSPAALSEPGRFELESGWLKSRNPDGSTRASLPWLLKYAFTDRFGVLVGSDAFVSETDAPKNRS